MQRVTITIDDELDAELERFMERWWAEYRTGVKRDQLSFTYVSWKEGVGIGSLGRSDPRFLHRIFQGFDDRGQHAHGVVLRVGALAHECPNAARLGLAGWPRAAEDSIVARDALLARDAGSRVHICNSSIAGTVPIFRSANAQGISIPAEVPPPPLFPDHRLLATYYGRDRVKAGAGCRNRDAGGCRNQRSSRGNYQCFSCTGGQAEAEAAKPRLQPQYPEARP